MVSFTDLKGLPPAYSRTVALSGVMVAIPGQVLVDSDDVIGRLSGVLAARDGVLTTGPADRDTVAD